MVANEEKVNKPRIEYIDISRALAIFLVVLGHTLTSGTVRTMIYSFHMPLFFIISGILLRPKTDFTIKELLELIKKRCRDYYVPYMIWALFYAAMDFSVFCKILYGSRETLDLSNSLTSLWFLPVLFCASCFSEIALFFVERFRHDFWGIIFCVIAYFIIGFSMPHPYPYGYPLGMDAGLVAAGFMLLGYLLKKVKQLIDESIIKYIIFTVTLLLLFFAVFYRYSPTVKVVAMYKGEYGNQLFFLLNALLGSLSIISLAVFLDKVLKRKMVLEVIGKNTMGILVLHKPLVRYCNALVIERGLSNNDLRVAVLIAILGMTLSLVIALQIMKIAPALLGK